MTAAVRPLAIIGPTGTGKSQLALDVAERLGPLGAEIVNADAMQLYRGMDIGTAKLPAAARRGIPHHQLDVLDVTQTATVARYQRAAAADIEAILAAGAVPIIVGGSMLYIQSLLDDWSFPATDPRVRARWERRLAEVGVGELHAELARRDPAAAAAILPTDARRTVRALEVIELTGRPFAASAPRIGAPRWDTVIIGLDCDTTLLDERLARRTDAMFEQGLVAEVTGLLGRGLRDGVTAARALGYAQVIAALDAGGGDEQLRQAREQTYAGTRRYVRRQRSWFRRDHRVRWLRARACSPPRLRDRCPGPWGHVSRAGEICEGAADPAPSHTSAARPRTAAAQMGREDPHAVAAHLGHRAVRVAVVHVPVAGGHAVGQPVQHARGGGGAGGGDPQHPRGAQPAPPVAQRGHAPRGQAQLGRGVAQQHEVVLGAVGLRKFHLLRIRRARRPGRRRRGGGGLRATARAQGRAPAPAGGGDGVRARPRENLAAAPRRYVRRQRSWFRRDHRVRWLDAGACSPPRLVDAALDAWRHVS